MKNIDIISAFKSFTKELKFNENHVSSGPNGGQFTEGSNSGGSHSELPTKEDVSKKVGKLRDHLNLLNARLLEGKIGIKERWLIEKRMEKMSEEILLLNERKMMGHGGMDEVYSDVNWLKQMIMHHKTALEMSKEVIDKSKNDKMIELAKKIIKAQTEEIKYMQSLIKQV